MNTTQIQIWKEAMSLVEEIYKMTRKFPDDERYGVISQIQRAAVSVPVNIAEGRGRHHTKEQIQFFYTSRGSLYEVVTLLKLSLSLKFINQKQHDEAVNKCENILRKLSGLINALKLSR